MNKRSVMKELSKLLRNILAEGGYDSNGRVRLYKDLSVECLVYGHNDIRDYVISKLKAYSQFKMESEFDLIWVDGKHTIYITIV